MLIKNKLVDIKNFFWFRLLHYYFISYPKCGRTWTRYFLSKYLEKKYNRPLSLKFDPLFKSKSGYPRIIYNHAEPHDVTLAKTQEWLNLLRGKRIFFLIRDPRDVIVSHYFEVTRRHDDARYEGMSVPEFARDKRVGIEQIVSYMNFWYQNRDKFDDFLLLQYEKLKQNPEKEFSRFINFLNIDLDQETLNYAIQESSFESMREAEENKELQSGRLQPFDEDDEQSYKTRKGEVGGYKEYFSKKDLEFLDLVVAEMHPDIRYD